MKLTFQTLIGGLFLTLGFTVSLLMSDASPALANGTVSCGPTTCYVGSEVKVDTGGGSNPGGGGGGNNGVPTTTTHYKAVDYWQVRQKPGNVLLPTRSNSFPLSKDEVFHEWVGRFYTPLTTYICPEDSRGIAALGMRYVREIATGKVLSYRCVYPVDPFPRTTTFDRVTGAQSWFYQTSLAGNASVYGAPGRLADTLPYQSAGFTMSNPERTTNVNRSWNARTLTDNGKPVYGYYRLEWKVDYVTVQKTYWPAWTGNNTVEYKQLRTYYTTSASPYTYACNLTPPLRAGIVSNAVFDVSHCATGIPDNPNPNVSYPAPPAVCELGGFNGSNLGAGFTAPRGGETFVRHSSGGVGSPSAVSPLSGVGDELVVMRDGSAVNVYLPYLVVRTLDSNVVRNVGNYKVMYVLDTNNISPHKKGVSENSKDQYYAATWRWNEWVNVPVVSDPIAASDYWATPAGQLRFFWSSDGKDKNFSFSTNYGFEADFRVPVQSGINGATSYAWVRDTVNCLTSPVGGGAWDGSGVRTWSPAIKVVRSVNSEG